MRIIAYILLLSLPFLPACRKGRKGVPACIHKHVRSFSASTACGSANVKEYRFQGKDVFVFDPGTCGADMSSEVKDENCTTLGYLGGISGNTKIEGEEFSSARYVQTVWKK